MTRGITMNTSIVAKVDRIGILFGAPTDEQGCRDNRHGARENRCGGS
jgi:hypothetical protein